MPAKSLQLARPHWSLLQGNRRLTLLALGCTLALTLPAYLFAPGISTGLALIATLFSMAWIAFGEWRNFQSIRRAYDMAMQAAHDGFWEWNPKTKALRVGQRLLQILGYHEDFLPDTHAWLRLVHPDDVAKYNQAVALHLKGESEYFYCEYRVLAKDGQYRWIASRGLAVRDKNGRAYQMVGSVTDITERHNHQEEMEFLARHDILTGLPNRLLFAEHLNDAIITACAEKSRLAVLFLDLDRFKNINDTLGHRAGDHLLQLVTERLRGKLPDNARIYRQGGDEFIVLLAPVTDSDAALAAAGIAKDIIATPITGDESDFFTSVSIGVSLYPDDASDGETLLRHADTAMYEAKSAGGNSIRMHTMQMDDRVSSRVGLETRLRRAIQEYQLDLHFQPKVDTQSGRLIGAEALLRWHDGEKQIPPDQFIPVAEESGLILPIGEWVIDRAIAQIATWRQQGINPVPIAINLSPRQFWRPSLAAYIIDKLQAAGVPNSALEVEVTESVLLDTDGGCIDELIQLRDAGIHIALDDFGTGYSSLSYLHRLPISTLKIDRSFINNLPLDGSASGSEPLVRAIVVMAKSLSLEIVAEGVETNAQYEFLKTLGCDTVQGYLTGRPVNAIDFCANFLVHRSITPASQA
jgi:diguanylate cyclase (GGDEF)-like protein/PAS domain S-box-containing protein